MYSNIQMRKQRRVIILRYILGTVLLTFCLAVLLFKAFVPHPMSTEEVVNNIERGYDYEKQLVRFEVIHANESTLSPEEGDVVYYTIDDTAVSDGDIVTGYVTDSMDVYGNKVLYLQVEEIE